MINRDSSQNNKIDISKETIIKTLNLKTDSSRLTMMNWLCLLGDNKFHSMKEIKSVSLLQKTQRSKRLRALKKLGMLEEDTLQDDNREKALRFNKAIDRELPKDSQILRERLIIPSDIYFLPPKKLRAYCKFFSWDYNKMREKINHYDVINREFQALVEKYIILTPKMVLLDIIIDIPDSEYKRFINYTELHKKIWKLIKLKSELIFRTRWEKIIGGKKEKEKVLKKWEYIINDIEQLIIRREIELIEFKIELLKRANGGIKEDLFNLYDRMKILDYELWKLQNKIRNQAIEEFLRLYSEIDKYISNHLENIEHSHIEEL